MHVYFRKLNNARQRKTIEVIFGHMLEFSWRTRGFAVRAPAHTPAAAKLMRQLS